VALLPVLALAVLVVVFAVKSLRRDPQVIPMATVGKPAPALTLAPLAGGPPTAVPIKGPVLVNFYASWCGPCVEESPALMALKAEGAPIVGVAYKDTPDATQGFLTRYGNPFRQVWLDADGRAGIAFGVTAVPETYAIDANGVIRGKHAGGLTADIAEDLLRKAGG
jgi:cytochrome c biogenesis protein CcmG/thiol:disulfide interchange protein DsbE